MSILVFSGSLRSGSWNTLLAKLAASELRARGAVVDEWDFRAASIPIYDPDTSDEHPAPGLVDFRARVAQSQAVLVSSPEYNYSIPGALKNLLDYASRPPKLNPFKGKLAAQLGATPGGGGTLQAQIMVRHVLIGLQMHSLPGAFTLSHAHEAFDAAGQLKEEAHRKQLGAFLDRFMAELVIRTRPPG